MTKICSKCKLELDISYFSKRSRSKDRLRGYCKECAYKYTKSYVESHKGWNKDYQKRYREKNRDILIANNKAYRLENKDVIAFEAKKKREEDPLRFKMYARKNYEKHRDAILARIKLPGVRSRIRDYDRKWRSTPLRKLSGNISRAIRHCLKGNKNNRHWENLIGYTVSDLQKHLESNFSKGMTWENYGEWEIDHIVPVCSFSFSSPEDNGFKECWKLSNLQPLWGKDNRWKSGSLNQRIVREVYGIEA